jgi:HEAT repeat protein
MKARKLALLVLALAACQSTVNGVRDPESHEGKFSEPTALLAEQIERQLADIPYLHGRQVMDACVALVRIGPVAIPQLIEAAKDGEPAKRSFAMNVLGALGDRRVLPTLREGLADADSGVRYEAARSCLRLGDWAAGMPVLIAGLADPSEFARTLCHDALRRQTGMDYGYSPKDSEVERAEATSRWRDWWSRHSKATLALRS